MVSDQCVHGDGNDFARLLNKLETRVKKNEESFTTGTLAFVAR